MMTGDANKWTHARHKGSKSGAEPPPENPSSINWGMLHDAVLSTFDRMRHSGMERSIASGSAADAVQNVIADLFVSFNAGEDPRTYEELLVKAEQGVRRQLSTWGRGERRRAVNVNKHAATFTTGDLFELICQRDEQRKFFSRMYEEAERYPEAKQLLILVLENDMPFKKTRYLAQVLDWDPAVVKRNKRRLVSIGGRVMNELTDPNPKGVGK
jgi:hypothetical protein